MSRCFLVIIPFIFLYSINAFSGWQVARPQSAFPREPFFQSGSPRKPVVGAYTRIGFPNQAINLGQPASIYAVSISGSLKENLERIMGRYHWKVIWKSPYDYNFDGRITGSSLPNVVEKLLQPFPLRAVMYLSNRTIKIIPRSKTGT